MTTVKYWDLIDPILDGIDWNTPQAFLMTSGRSRGDVIGLLAAHYCDAEVCNGGFHQFFHNSTGIAAPEAVQGFRAVGQVEIADIVQEAMGKLGPSYPRDRKKRLALLKQIPREAFEQLEDRFYSLIWTENGGFESAADQFADRLSCKADGEKPGGQT